MTTKFHDIRDQLTINGQAFIDGVFCEAADGGRFETINPATDEVITSVARCGAADVDRAVAVARRVFQDGRWSRCAPEQRKETLFRLAALIEPKTQFCH